MSGRPGTPSWPAPLSGSLDTGLSLTLGFTGHAAFNVAFAVAWRHRFWRSAVSYERPERHWITMAVVMSTKPSSWSEARMP